MPRRIDIRAELSVGRHALDPGRVCLIAEWLCDRPRRVPDLIELLWDDDPGLAASDRFCLAPYEYAVRWPSS